MKKFSVAAVASIAVALASSAPAWAQQSVDAREGARIATEAYIYGYPLVTADMTRRQQTNVTVADSQHAPMGQLIKLREYIPPDNHCCAAPNNDTLYTMAWLNVSKEPWIFSIPDMGSRFYIMPFLDGWNEVFGVAGSRATGQKAQTYAVTGPGWKGSLPAGVHVFASPTAIVWILGRIYATGTPGDYRIVHALQDRFRLVPLHSYGKTYTPPRGIVDTSFDMKTAVRKQVDGLDAFAYFNYLARLLKDNPPKPKDAPILADMAKIGIVPGEEFNENKLRLLDKATLGLVPKAALLKIVVTAKESIKPVNGWIIFKIGGMYGTDYLYRALVTAIGPGLNFPEDAVYPFSEKGPDGKKYDGAHHNYVIHFAKGGLPPVRGFWSLSMYDSQFFFVPNAFGRYELSQRNHFVINADGSIDFYLQNTSPGKAKEPNWLPAPSSNFVPMLRLYWPNPTPPSILNGSWQPPPIQTVK